jgi:hypothetical protein
MGRRRGSDNFNFNSFKANAGINNVPTVKGSDNQGQLLRPLPFERRFRPAVGTKDFSVLSDYDYASLWSRWRRGYELSMYSQEAYGGLTYSFKYFVSGFARNRRFSSWSVFHVSDHAVGHEDVDGWYSST